VAERRRPVPVCDRNYRDQSTRCGVGCLCVSLARSRSCRRPRAVHARAGVARLWRGARPPRSLAAALVAVGGRGHSRQPVRLPPSAATMRSARSRYTKSTQLMLVAWSSRLGVRKRAGRAFPSFVLSCSLTGCVQDCAAVKGRRCRGARRLRSGRERPRARAVAVSASLPRFPRSLSSIPSAGLLSEIIGAEPSTNPSGGWCAALLLAFCRCAAACSCSSH